ncbi:hypothetical protein AURDEDRAFT_170757 [Auricularia subglabra TFB-10046 SS5]|uniref:Uncharacterized protein n=1 Tax=Auricularia subglabra (strain TFB-10046 / SS5) TaxID=717982 RepID=J0LJJ0_AURST|nr:hypothetical protein AURDEDRAFT_170757 [Auricularia subglabra TFB-10046 SS5]
MEVLGIPWLAPEPDERGRENDDAPVPESFKSTAPIAVGPSRMKSVGAVLAERQRRVHCHREERMDVWREMRLVINRPVICKPVSTQMLSRVTGSRSGNTCCSMPGDGSSAGLHFDSLRCGSAGASMMSGSVCARITRAGGPGNWGTSYFMASSESLPVLTIDGRIAAFSVMLPIVAPRLQAGGGGWIIGTA